MSATNNETQKELQKMSVNIRAQIATISKCKYILKSLSEDREPKVRATVALNKSACWQSLAKLAKDEDAYVRAAAVTNENMHKEFVKLLCNDTNPYVASLAKSVIKLQD